MLSNLIRCVPSAAVAALAAVTLGAAAPAPGVIPHTMIAANAIAPNTIAIDNFTFGPQDATVPVGTTVTWVNRDDIPHTVVAVDKSFRSKVLDTDEKFSFTFAKAGTFEYFCSIHPHMTGKVVVK